MSRSNARTERTDLARFLPPAATQPKTAFTQALILATERQTDDHSAATDDLALSAASGKRVRSCTLLATQFIRMSFPRGMPWTEFPVVSDPWFVFQPVKSGAYSAFDFKAHRSKTAATVEMSDVFADHDAYAIEVRREKADPLALSLELFKLAYAVKRLGNRDAPVFLKIVTGIEEGRLDGEWVKVDVDEILAAHSAYAAFRYSYSLNFRVIAMKALRGATNWDHFDTWFDEMKSKEYESQALNTLQRVAVFRGKKFRAGQSLPDLEHPLATQFLYALRKGGPIECSPPRGYDAPNLVAALFVADRNRGGLTWAGNGKHAPALIGVGREAALDLYSCGLVHLSRRKSLSITDAGERFLDAIHPDCEDPDVLVRWIDPETGFVRPHSAASMDDWVMKHFLKMKTRVNLIPEESTLVPKSEVRGITYRMPWDAVHQDENWYGEVA